MLGAFSATVQLLSSNAALIDLTTYIPLAQTPDTASACLSHSFTVDSSSLRSLFHCSFTSPPHHITLVWTSSTLALSLCFACVPSSCLSWRRGTRDDLAKSPCDCCLHPSSSSASSSSTHQEQGDHPDSICSTTTSIPGLDSAPGQRRIPQTPPATR